MLLTKLKSVAAVLLVLTTVAFGGGLVVSRHTAAAQEGNAKKSADPDVKDPANDGRPTREELAARAAKIRPTAAELRWQQIPWLGSLVEARNLARAEKRPVLVWSLTGDPFERC